MHTYLYVYVLLEDICKPNDMCVVAAVCGKVCDLSAIRGCPQLGVAITWAGRGKWWWRSYDRIQLWNAKNAMTLPEV